MVWPQTGNQIEARHLGHLHPRRPASIRPRYYYHEPRSGLQVFKVYSVGGKVN